MNIFLKYLLKKYFEFQIESNNVPPLVTKEKKLCKLKNYFCKRYGGSF